MCLPGSKCHSIRSDIQLAVWDRLYAIGGVSEKRGMRVHRELEIDSGKSLHMQTPGSVIMWKL
jgi:hypothetical protein